MNKRNIMMNCSTLVLALSLMLCLMTACGKKKPNTSLQWVNVVELTPTAGTASASYPAKTEAMHITDLAFRVLGTIEQVLVKEGDPVTAGQVVARLYERDYSTQLRATEAEYRQISAECERVAEMYKDRAVSDNNYDKARYGLQQITEKLTNHRNQLADCVLRAPFDGYVNEIYKHKIETVAPGQPILSVYSSNGVEVVIHIPERAYAHRKPDDTYTVTFGSLPGRSFPLAIRTAATMANDNHLYEMHLVLKENVPEITPGMSAMVEVNHKQDASDGTTSLGAFASRTITSTTSAPSTPASIAPCSFHAHSSSTTPQAIPFTTAPTRGRPCRDAISPTPASGTLSAASSPS